MCVLRYKVEPLEELLHKFEDSEGFKARMPRENPQIENHGNGTQTGPGRESTRNKSLKSTITFNKIAKDSKNICITEKRGVIFPGTLFLVNVIYPRLTNPSSKPFQGLASMPLIHKDFKGSTYQDKIIFSPLWCCIFCFSFSKYLIHRLI